MMFLNLGTRKVLVVSSPSAVEECFTKNDITFANRPQTLASQHLGYNGKIIGFASYGEFWRSLRRLTTVELFEECRGQQVMSMLKVDLRARLVDIYFSIMLRMISGKRYYGEHEISQDGKVFKILMKEFTELIGSGNLNDFLPILQWVDFQGVEKKMVKVMKKMDSFFEKLIHEHRRNRGVSGGKKERNRTLVDVILDLQQTEPEFYTDEVVKGVIMAMLVGGSENSATTMEWALSLLLNHPEKLNKVRDEMDTYVGKDQHLINELDTIKLKYLQNVITETLRLYPAVPLLVPHESSIDCKVCDFDIPRGTTLLVNVWTMHRDANLWVDPTRFEPERFEGREGGDHETLHNMIPFGIGRRACPGAVFAKRFMGHALSALIQCFEWDTIGDEEINMTEGMGLTVHKVEPLVALCRPRQCMLKVLSNI